jgi:hypothetical protein
MRGWLTSDDEMERNHSQIALLAHHQPESTEDITEILTKSNRYSYRDSNQARPGYESEVHLSAA